MGRAAGPVQIVGMGGYMRTVLAERAARTEVR